MIYILVGSDNKKRNLFEKDLFKNREFIFVKQSNATVPFFVDQAVGVQLFGASCGVVAQNFFFESDILFTDKELEILSNSETVFIFREDTLLVSEEKKYKKYATIVRFDEPKKRTIPRFDSFGVANAFAQRDKIKAWIAYRELVESGVAPELVSGALFWKIKTMILSGTKVFSKEELVSCSSHLVSLYHESHRGEKDFEIGLEQFILSSLSK